MKNNHFIIGAVALTLISNAVYAQNNQSNPGNQGLWQSGTSQNGNKAVVTKRDVGIGKSTPNSPLDVKGQILGDSLHIFGVARFGNTISLNAPVSDAIGSNTGKIYLLGAPPFSNSEIQVGIGTTTPFSTLPLVYGLEVNNDINLTSSVQNHGYRINGAVVLQKPGTSNIFVGEGAGFLNTTGGQQNTFIGKGAGYNNADAYGNSFIGSYAGYSNTTDGIFNTFVGNSAGNKNNIGWANSFIGSGAGFKNTSGLYNSFMGYNTGYNNTSGQMNSFYGVLAGYSNGSAWGNSFFGSFSGNNNSASNAIHNSFFGIYSGYNNTGGLLIRLLVLIAATAIRPQTVIRI